MCPLGWRVWGGTPGPTARPIVQTPRPRRGNNPGGVGFVYQILPAGCFPRVGVISRRSGGSVANSIAVAVENPTRRPARVKGQVAVELRLRVSAPLRERARACQVPG